MDRATQPAPPPMHVDVAGTRIAITLPTQDDLSDAILGRLAARQGFALATLNLDHLVKLGRDPAFRAAYAQHEFVTADGNPVVWLSRLADRPVGLLHGSDLVVPIARLAAAADAPVALIGSTREVLDAAAKVLCAQVEGLRIAYTLAPPHGFEPDSAAAHEILTALSRTDTRLCFLAFGAPKQERLAAHGRRLAPQIGFVSIGAGLDFLAGAQHRAPRIVRRLALEWLWRLLSQPRRLWQRYLLCILILPRHARAALRLRNGR